MLVQRIAELAAILRDETGGDGALVSITVSEAGRMALMRDVELLNHTPQPWIRSGYIEIAGVRILVDRSVR